MLFGQWRGSKAWYWPTAGNIEGEFVNCSNCHFWGWFFCLPLNGKKNELHSPDTGAMLRTVLLVCALLLGEESDELQSPGLGAMLFGGVVVLAFE